MYDLTEYESLLCHTMTVLDLEKGSQDPFTGGRSPDKWVPIAQSVPCRLSGSAGRLQDLLGRKATPQERLLHTLDSGLKAGMRIVIDQPGYDGQTFEVGAPYPAFGREAVPHHYEVVITLIDPATSQPPEA